METFEDQRDVSGIGGASPKSQQSDGQKFSANAFPGSVPQGETIPDAAIVALHELAAILAPIAHRLLASGKFVRLNGRLVPKDDTIGLCLKEQSIQT